MIWIIFELKFWVLPGHLRWETQMPREMKNSILANNYRWFVACLWGSRCSFTVDIVSEIESHNHQKSSKGLWSVSQEQFTSSCVSSSFIPLERGEKTHWKCTIFLIVVCNLIYSRWRNVDWLTVMFCCLMLKEVVSCNERWTKMDSKRRNAGRTSFLSQDRSLVRDLGCFLNTW